LGYDSQSVSEGRRGGVGAASWVKGGLERGGDSSEGASGPRARRRLARGGVRPSSEAENLWRGVWSSSETETRPRGTAACRLVGRCGFLGRGPFVASGRGHVKRVLRVCLFAFYYFSKGVFFPVIRGPLWLSLTQSSSLPPTRPTSSHKSNLPALNL
jgi:hypothetical protein